MTPRSSDPPLGEQARGVGYVLLLGVAVLATGSALLAVLVWALT